MISLNTAIYDGTTKTGSYSRTELINMLDSQKYAIWDQSGVLTFRGGPLRQNAAYGTVEIESGTMSVLWQVAVEGNQEDERRFAKRRQLAGTGGHCEMAH